MNLYFEMTFSLPSPLSLLKLPTISTKARNSRPFSCSCGKRFGKYFFPVFFAGFSKGLTESPSWTLGLTYVDVVRTTLVATQLFKSSIGGI